MKPPAKASCVKYDGAGILLGVWRALPVLRQDQITLEDNQKHRKEKWSS